MEGEGKGTGRSEWVILNFNNWRINSNNLSNFLVQQWFDWVGVNMQFNLPSPHTHTDMSLSLFGNLNVSSSHMLHNYEEKTNTGYCMLVWHGRLLIKWYLEWCVCPISLWLDGILFPYLEYIFELETKKRPKSVRNMCRENQGHWAWLCWRRCSLSDGTPGTRDGSSNTAWGSTTQCLEVCCIEWWGLFACVARTLTSQRASIPWYASS